MRMVEVSDISECHSKSQHTYSLFCKAVSNYIFLMLFLHVLYDVYSKNEALYAYDYLMESLSEAFPRPGPNYLKADVFSLRLSSGIFCGMFSSSKNL